VASHRVFAAARIGLALFIPAADPGRRNPNVIKLPEKKSVLRSGLATSPGTELEDRRKMPPEKQG
jgi:hypothetical protein